MIYGNYLRDKYASTAVKLADAEGVPCVMEYSKGKNLRNYEIYGNSVQEGTPAPDTPVEIQSVGDLTTKNLLDYTTVSARSGTTVAFIDNGFVYTGNYYFEFDGSFLEIGSTYVMSWNFEGNDTLTPTWRLAYEDGTYSSTVQNGVSRKIAKSVSKILVYPEMSNTTYTTTFTNIQLELGSTATEYEPYHKYDIPITVTGKNLFNLTYISDISNWETHNSAGYTRIPIYIGIKKTITISWDITSYNNSSDKVSNLYMCINNNDTPNTSNRFWLYHQTIQHLQIENITTNTSSNGYIYLECSGCYNQLQLNNFTQKVLSWNFQIEIGESVTEYEPYSGETKHIYLNEPLRKVGDYADYIDFKNQKFVRNVIKQSLNINNIYKKLNSVIRFDSTPGIVIKHKHDSHILSPIFHFAFDYNLGWNANIECIFHHPYADYTLYWSVYWSRLGLAYDGTNVYRIDDTEQTPLTDREIIRIAKEWLSKLSDKDKEIYVILGTPTEESVSLPTLKTVKGTSIMSVNTTIQPSNIKTKYVRL